MNNHPSARGDGPSLPLTLALQVDEICEAFEAAWQKGERPNLGDFAADIPDRARRLLLLELIQLDAHYRRRAGESPGATEYVERFPELDSERVIVAAETRLGDPTLPDAPPLSESSPLSSRLAGYEILEEIGRGGMGVVFRARDLSLNRDVAIKMLPVGRGWALARRFLEEAQITGQLQHPCIPAVHQAGITSDGRPFLAMKLIQGRTLDAIVRSHPDPAADHGRLLSVFEQVAQAIGYSHSRGVIHRDLKPANIMVGAFGETQVMDWGLAKVLGDRPSKSNDSGSKPQVVRVACDRESDSQTQTGSLLGTPAFMAPEQAVGAIDEVDERSDVFGLGAVLCVILTGKPPYVGVDAESTRQLAAHARLDGAFERLQACNAAPELVQLCRQCLNPDKSDRPAHGGEVAEAIAALRSAADERARDAEKAQAAAEAKAVEQRKRRRIQLLLAATIFLLLAGASATAWWLDRQASNRRSQQAAQAFEDQLAEQRRTIAERERLGRNEQAMNSLLSECQEALLADERDRATTALAQAERRLPDGGGEALASRFAACRADLALLRELDRIDELNWTWADNRFQTPEAVAAIAALFRGLGFVPGEHTAATAARLVTGSRIRNRLLAAMDFWRMHDGSPALYDALAAVDDDHFRNEIRKAMRPKDTEKLLELLERAEALDQPAWFAAILSHYKVIPVERRREIMRAAHRREPTHLALMMAMGGSFPGRRAETAAERAGWFRSAVAVRPRNAAAWINLSEAELRLKNFSAAALAAREAIRLDASLAFGHANLAEALRQGGDPEGALPEAQEAVRLSPADPELRNGLGLTLSDLGRIGDAIEQYLEAVRRRPLFASGLVNLGTAYSRMGDNVKARGYFEQAIAADPNDPITLLNLGRVLRALKLLDDAAVKLRESIRLDSSNPVAHELLAQTLKELNRGDESVAAYRAAVAANPNRASAHYLLGLALNDRGDRSGAIAAYREAVRLKPDHAMAHNNLANAIRLDGDLRGAIVHLRKAVAADAKLVPAHFNLGQALHEVRDVAGAMHCFRTVISLDPKHASGHFKLAILLRETGKLDEAIAEYREATRLDPKHAIAHVQLGMVLHERRQLNEAMTMLRKGIALDPTYPAGHYACARVHAELGEIDVAIASYREAIRLDPKFTFAHNNLGVLLRDKKDDLDGAIQCFRAALQVDHKLPQAIRNLETTLKLKAERKTSEKTKPLAPKS